MKIFLIGPKFLPFKYGFNILDCQLEFDKFVKIIDKNIAYKIYLNIIILNFRIISLTVEKIKK
jgi:hypothetical protein